LRVGSDRASTYSETRDSVYRVTNKLSEQDLTPYRQRKTLIRCTSNPEVVRVHSSSSSPSVSALAAFLVALGFFAGLDALFDAGFLRFFPAPSSSSSSTSSSSSSSFLAFLVARFAVGFFGVFFFGASSSSSLSLSVPAASTSASSFENSSPDSESSFFLAARF